MSWKNTQQNSFTDSLVVQHKSLSELDDVHNNIFWPEIEHPVKSIFICSRCTQLSATDDV